MFLISLFLILFSTYFFSSCVAKNSAKNLFFIYFLLIAFSQIVLNFEILSLLNSINKEAFLIGNIIFLIISFVLWKKNQSEIIEFGIREELVKIKTALKLDRFLSFLSILFCVFIVIKLLNIFFVPVTFGDSLSYYFTRCVNWIAQGNLNHYITSDVRELIMPVNMDLLYTWIFLFLKNERGTAIFSFISFITLIYVFYNLLGTLKISIRKRLWTIIVFSSFSLISALMVTPCADVFIGALILSSIYLFLHFAKDNNKTALYFSTLAYALAIGSKTTSLIMFPATLVVLVFLLKMYQKENLYKNLCLFLFLLTFNFLIFSSYNYILNFIQFGSPLSSEAHVLINKSFGGIRAYFYVLIKYFFVFFDASGIEGIDFYNNFITNLQEKVLKFFGMKPIEYLSAYYPQDFMFSSSVTPLDSFLGLFGIFALIPCLLLSCKRICSKNVRFSFFALIGLTLVLNIAIFSSMMIFTNVNMRYLASFVCVASPVLLFSYVKSNKNIYKIVLSVIAFLYLFNYTISVEIPIILSYIKSKENIQWKNIERDEITIRNYLQTQPNKNVLMYISGRYTSGYDISKLVFDGYVVDKRLIENIKDYSISKYDFIVTNGHEFATSTIIANNNKSCTYLGHNKTVVSGDSKKGVVRVKCPIPFDYFIENGFEEIKDFQLLEYKVFKKKNS